MSLLNVIRNASIAAHNASAAARKDRRRRKPSMDCLEERKVLSTATTTGAFDGMTWSYAYDNVAKSAVMTITDAPGSHTIDIAATHPNLSPGDPGYSPAHENDITGIELTDRQNGITGGTNIVVGTKVNVIVNRLAGDNTFVNDEPSFKYSVGPRTVTVTPTPTPVPTPQPTPTPGVAQTGSSLGLTWRFAPDGSSSGGGTLFVQGVAKGTNSLDKTNEPIAINQDNGHIIFDVDYMIPFNGPAVGKNARVNVVVAQHPGDIKVYDDRGRGDSFRTEDRLQSGNIQVANGRYLGWTLETNVVTQKATFTITSGNTDRSTYYIAPSYLNLSPGDPGYNPNHNPLVGLTVGDSQGNQGGISFDEGTNVSIVTTGGASYKNSSPFTMVSRTASPFNRVFN